MTIMILIGIVVLIAVGSFSGGSSKTKSHSKKGNSNSSELYCGICHKQFNKQDVYYRRDEDERDEDGENEGETEGCCPYCYSDDIYYN